MTQGAHLLMLGRVSPYNGRISVIKRIDAIQRRCFITMPGLVSLSPRGRRKCGGFRTSRESWLLLWHGQECLPPSKQAAVFNEMARCTRCHLLPPPHDSESEPPNRFPSPNRAISSHTCRKRLRTMYCTKNKTLYGRRPGRLGSYDTTCCTNDQGHSLLRGGRGGLYFIAGFSRFGSAT